MDLNNKKKVIGVFGSSFTEDNELKKKAFIVGQEIARNNCFLLTGATTGLPYEAAKGAKSEKGFVLGISPASSSKEHQKIYQKPLKNHDLIIYTGAGFQGRNLINIKSVDSAIFINGGIGTLNEFTIAYKEDKIIGILEKSGGISEKINEIVDSLYLKTDSIIIYEQDPKKLVEKIIDEMRKL
jgi:uncharacterized protein (TIGR00725 family)